MQKVVTASEMQAIDRSAIEEFGIPGLVLMENAGLAAASLIHENVPDLLEKKSLSCAVKATTVATDL